MGLYWGLASVLRKTGCSAGTGVEVLGGTETGGGIGWGDKPLIFLPFPLLLLFLSTLWAEDKAQVEPLSLPGLLDVVEEVGGFDEGTRPP